MIRNHVLLLSFKLSAKQLISCILRKWSNRWKNCSPKTFGTRLDFSSALFPFSEIATEDKRRRGGGKSSTMTQKWENEEKSAKVMIFNFKHVDIEFSGRWLASRKKHFTTNGLKNVDLSIFRCQCGVVKSTVTLILFIDKLTWTDCFIFFNSYAIQY